MKKTILILGSSGMIGGLILSRSIKSDDVKKIILINRKSLNITNRKVQEVIHDNFLNFSKVSKHFKNIDIAYYCVGVYTGNKMLKIVTVGFAKSFIKTLEDKSPNSTLGLFSAQGADRTEMSKIAFAKYKGIAENIALNSKIKNVQIFRPGYIYPITPRTEPNLHYKLFRILYPIAKRIFPNNVITSQQLAKVIFEQTITSSKSRTYENKEMKLL